MPSTDVTPLILVDENDHPVGVYEKLQAHKEGLLHRAFSVFLYNDKGELLIQQRAFGKYHSAGLWANTCCGHPCPGEDSLGAAKRRVQEELGIICPSLENKGHVLYRLKLDNGLYEFEYVHIFQGVLSESVRIFPNSEEVVHIDWVTPNALRQKALLTPDHYARWIKLYLFKYFNHVFNSPCK